MNPSPTARAPATIVAFDGLIVHTLEARAVAITEALAAEGVPVSITDIARVLPGRSLDEAIDSALFDWAATAGAIVDPTVRDLVVLRARGAWAAIVSRGLPLCRGAADWLSARAASYGRVLLRADSGRADVERLLAFSGLIDVLWAVRCADDPPRSAAVPTIGCSWRAIAERLTGHGVIVAQSAAYESAEYGAAVAREFTLQVTVKSSLS